MALRRLLILCLASAWLSGCSGTIGADDFEPVDDAGLDAGGDDAGDLRDGGDLEDAGIADAAADARDAGADEAQPDGGDAGGDPSPERCPPLSGDPPVHGCLEAGWTVFTAGHLLLLDAPSMASAGTDFILQLTPQGEVIQTVVGPGSGILGMRDAVLDPSSGHLLYSVSEWTSQIFEIREVDATGNLLHTYPMPAGMGGGDIAMAFDQLGTLHVAYDNAIFRKPAGESALTRWLDLPEGQGLGEIDLDRRGNIYLTDPHVTESVMRMSPDGSLCTLAGPEEGLNSPYGLTVLPNDEIFVTSINPDGHACRIFKIDAGGGVSLYADDVAPAGSSMRGLDVDAAGQLYATSEGFQPALLRIDSDGSHEVVAGDAQGLIRPARVVSVSTPYPCE
ncbi:MAG: hypothetical protein JXR96_27040 [Deltaproteobacteria bacterium]|nr:hypothetical protein [Deltaproteobacteria bacterium]